MGEKAIRCYFKRNMKIDIKKIKAICVTHLSYLADTDQIYNFLVKYDEEINPPHRTCENIHIYYNDSRVTQIKLIELHFYENGNSDISGLDNNLFKELYIKLTPYIRDNTINMLLDV